MDDSSKSEIHTVLDDLLETLASIEHERWAHWQSYVHQKAHPQSDGSLIIPAELVSRWDHQIATTYDKLSDKEKDSDREQVRKYLSVIKAAFS